MDQELLLENIASPPTSGTDAEDDLNLETATLPLRDKDLPPIIREIVSNAPANRKLPSFVASLSPLCKLPQQRVAYFSIGYTLGYFKKY